MNIKEDLGIYVNEYVAFGDSSENADVVAHGDRVHHVYRDALEQGFDNPVITFIPPADMICSY